MLMLWLRKVVGYAAAAVGVSLGLAGLVALFTRFSTGSWGLSTPGMLFVIALLVIAASGATVGVRPFSMGDTTSYQADMYRASVEEPMLIEQNQKDLLERRLQKGGPSIFLVLTALFILLIWWISR